MNGKTLIAILLVPALILAGGISYAFVKPFDRGTNGSGSHASIQPAAPANEPKGLGEIVNASNRFALELFSNLSDPADNLFFSPYSIFTAMGMTFEGARGQTADEMEAVFHFPRDNQTRWSLFKALIDKLIANDTGCNLSTADAYWVQQDFKLLDSYVNTVRDYYSADAFSVDYLNAAEAARQRINGWVENRTNDRIKDLIPQGVLDSSTRLVLTNAIYFKGGWLKQFNETMTKDSDFHTGPDTTVQVPMMARKDDESKFNYTEDGETQVLEMMYSGGNLSMLVLLPKSGDTAALEKSINPEKLNAWRARLEEQRVDVYFPRFKLETKYTLNDVLSKMGMPSAFVPYSADLSGIDGTRDLYISKVIHQAFVSVNESGTEAAGATAVAIERLGIPIGPKVPVFNADHPFIFIIQDNDTGNILFMGKVVDPTK